MKEKQAVPQIVLPLTEIFAALAIGMCLAAMAWSWILLRQPSGRYERFQVRFIGLLALFNGLRLLRTEGVFTAPSMATLERMVEFIVGSLYLAALLVVHLSRREQQPRSSPGTFAEGAPSAADPATGPAPEVGASL